MDKVEAIALVITENPDEILGDENQIAELYTLVSRDADAIITREMNEIVKAIERAKADERLKPLGDKVENELKSNIVSPLKNFVKGLLKNVAQEPATQIGPQDTQLAATKIAEPAGVFGESTIIESLLLEALKLGIPKGIITKLYSEFKSAIERATTQIGEKIELHFDRFKDVPDKTKEKIRDGLERALIPSRNLAKRLGAAITKLGAGAHLGGEQTETGVEYSTSQQAAQWVDKVEAWASKAPPQQAQKAIQKFYKHFGEIYSKARQAVAENPDNVKARRALDMASGYISSLQKLSMKKFGEYPRN